MISAVFLGKMREGFLGSLGSLDSYLDSFGLTQCRNYLAATVVFALVVTICFFLFVLVSVIQTHGGSQPYWDNYFL